MGNQTSLAPQKAPVRRNLGYWLLMLGFAAFSTAGWVRMVQALSSWFWLARFGVDPGPLYLAATGALWGIAGLAAVLWLGLRRPRLRPVAVGVAVFLALTYWMDRLLFGQDNGLGNNLGFALLVTVVGLGYTLFVLRPRK